MPRKLSFYILPLAALLAFTSLPQRGMSQTGPEPPPTDPPPPPPKNPTPPVPPTQPSFSQSPTSLAEVAAIVLHVYGLA